MTADELEKTVAILEKVAGQFPADSEESKAVELGAWALHFAFRIETQRAFVKFISERAQPPTEAHILHLRATGIDPDTLTDAIE
jgi:glutamate mutase epsilon subunit